MEGVDLAAEKGVGPWLRARRKKLGMSQRETAGAAEIGERTIQRYEKDEGPAYELLRLLDALGVKLRPGPVSRSARALNTEVHELRDRLVKLEATVIESADTTAASLEALERGIARIEAGLPGAGDQAREVV